MANYNTLSRTMSKLLYSYQRRCILPYGQFIEEGGYKVIFDRKTRPICRVHIDGTVEILSPAERIKFVSREWFYNDSTIPLINSDTRRSIREIIKRYGIEAELLARIALDKKGQLLPQYVGSASHE